MDPEVRANINQQILNSTIDILINNNTMPTRLPIELTDVEKMFKVLSKLVLG